MRKSYNHLINRFITFTFILISLGCKNEDDSISPIQTLPCRLTEFDHERIYRIEYDSKDRMQEIQVIISTSSFKKKPEYSSNTLVKLLHIDEAVQDVVPYTEFEYNNMKLPTRINFWSIDDSPSNHSNLVNTYSYIFEYGTDSKPVKRSYYFYGTTTQNPTLSYYAIDEYNNKGNLVKSSMYNSSGILEQTTEYEYDDKINGLMPILFAAPEFVVYHQYLFSKNNVTKYTSRSKDGNVHISTYTYEYNAESLPIKKTVTTDAGYVYEYKFEYDCQ